MQKRYVSIWFPQLITDWLCIRRPAYLDTVFVFAKPEHGRKIITAVSPAATAYGIRQNMPVADARAVTPDLHVFEDRHNRAEKLLIAIGDWCIRFSPAVAIDLPDGILLEATGCSHLYGGEQAYLQEIINRLEDKGYRVSAAMADTMAAAWAVARFGASSSVIESNRQLYAILPLPPAALRLDPMTLQKLQKLGLHQVKSFVNIHRSALRRRFGTELLLKLGQAIGQEKEHMMPLQIIPDYQERLPSLEPICTAAGIKIAIQQLLEALCKRLQEEGKGLRTAVLKCYRIDGKMVHTTIGTNKPSHHIAHLFKLFELKISGIEPALGIELFILEATKVENAPLPQESLWATGSSGLDDEGITELLDRLSVKLGSSVIHRYLPDEHYWPERSIKIASSLTEKPEGSWRKDRPRPTQMLSRPEPVEVTAPIPDYPPMLFRYKGEVHHIKRADGPERIEREWWLEKGEHRDYYRVEDEHGQRYWIFRSGHYNGDRGNHWFLHGYFA